MRKRALAVVLSICILLSVPAALCGLAFGLPAQHDQTYLAALQDKPDRIQSASAPRIVPVGGSGTAFDVRSDLLEQELPGYSGVNFGLCAGLGTTVMLDLCKPVISFCLCHALFLVDVCRPNDSRVTDWCLWALSIAAYQTR